MCQGVFLFSGRTSRTTFQRSSDCLMEPTADRLSLPSLRQSDHPSPPSTSPTKTAAENNHQSSTWCPLPLRSPQAPWQASNESTITSPDIQHRLGHTASLNTARAVKGVTLNTILLSQSVGRFVFESQPPPSNAHPNHQYGVTHKSTSLRQHCGGIPVLFWCQCGVIR